MKINFNSDDYFPLKKGEDSKKKNLFFIDVNKYPQVFLNECSHKLGPMRTVKFAQ